MRRIGHLRLFSILLFIVFYTGEWAFSRESYNEFCLTSQPKIFYSTQKIGQFHLLLHSNASGDGKCRFEIRSQAMDPMLFFNKYKDTFATASTHKKAEINTVSHPKPLYDFISGNRSSKPIYLINQSFLI